MTHIEEVRKFWEEHPLCAYEIPHPPGSRQFFQVHDRLKEEGTDRYSKHLWEFDRHRGQRILDVGCGPGWLVQEFALGGACVSALDLTSKALELTKKRLSYRRLKADLVKANAEDLPFAEGCFDFVTASGVLHHTPETMQSIDEVHRVLRKGGQTVISLYYRSLFFSPFLWPLTRLIIRSAFLKTGFREESHSVTRPEDFVRLYDGDENPLGRSYSVADIRRMFARFSCLRWEIHYFPKRFFDPFIRINHETLLRLLDRHLGTMIFVLARK
jgi:SAM-dependent methyltransferase